jgi:hypothetical protein
MLLSQFESTPYPQPPPPAEHPSCCYFSYVPATASLVSSPFSIETPTSSPGPYGHSTNTTSDPTHPLLAQRSLANSSQTTMNVSRVLQLQTAAAYGSRPNSPSPSRSILSSSSSSSTSTSVCSTPPHGPIRCSRCHCESVYGLSNPTAGMVSYGANLYYCNRCADLVGYRR